MSRRFKSILAAFALAAGPAFASGSDEPIEVNTDGLQSHVAEQVRQHAAQSERSLMQYMWFTRRTHHLWLDDVTKPKAEADAQTAGREKNEIRVVRLYTNY